MIQNPLPPPRDREIERLLVPAGSRPLTLEALQQACLAPLTRLLVDAAVWPDKGYGRSWKVGDFNILIIETPIAPDASLYVQFWSEPNGQVDWEVSSGNWNPPARPFITARTRRCLAEMGFVIGGKAKNFGRNATVANRADAAAVARDVLRIFHEAFGYRGATPLVARLVKAERAGRAVVHTRFEPTDIVTLLNQLGYAAEWTNRRAKRPVVLASLGDFRVLVTMDVKAKEGGFECLDIGTVVGEMSQESASRWLSAINELNSHSRTARAWVDGDGDVIVGTSVMCRNGVTEGYLADRVTGWLYAASELLTAGEAPKAGGGAQRKKSGVVVH